MIFAGIGIWGLVSRVIYLLTSEAIHVTSLFLSDPSEPAWAQTSDRITSAHYESAEITVRGLGATARGWFVAEAAASMLLTIGLCVVVAWLGMRLLYGGPFVRSVTWAVGGAAILVVASGMSASLFGAIARAEVVEFLGLPEGSGEGLAAFVMTLDPAVLGWGLALAVAAGAFQVGERLQRDTHGLV